MVTQTQPRGTLKKAALTVQSRVGHDWYYTVDGQTWRLHNISYTTHDPVWQVAIWDGNWFVCRGDLSARTRHLALLKIDQDMDYDKIYNPRMPHEYHGWLVA